jgi:adenylyltransferase/sulfurtransferase
MMQSEANLLKPNPWGTTVGRISELPIVGNRVLQSQVAQISVQRLKQLLDQEASNLILIDVRYESEYALGQVPGSVLVPFPEIQSGQGITKIKQLLDEKRQSHPGVEPHLIVICKAGIRSAKALVLLQEAGIAGTNVTGGIHAWSKEIDSSIPQYSIKDISEFQPTLAKQNLMKQRWLSGGSLVVASLTVAAVFAARYNPNLFRPTVHAGVTLEHASVLSKQPGK